MAIQSSFYSSTALDSRTFPSSKHIATKQHMAIWIQKVEDDSWVQMDIGDYQLINNSCVLNSVLNTSIYYNLEVRVADEPDELATSPSDIAIVASSINDVATVSGNMDKMKTVVSNINNINTVSSNIINININAADIANIKVVADSILSGSIINSQTQLLGGGLIKGIQYMSKTSQPDENIVVKDGTNAFSVESFELADGASLTIEDGATYKIL